MKKEKLTSKEIGDELVLHVFSQFSKAKNNAMSSKEIAEKAEAHAAKIIPKRDYPDMYETYKRGGYPKWRNYMYFSIIKFVKAGMLRNEKKVWYLEKGGADLLAGKASDEEIIAVAQEGYLAWKKAQGEAETSAVVKSGKDNAAPDNIAETEEAAEEGMEKAALDDMQNHINKIDPYEYQNLVAALLRGMGYFVSEVAGKGADGGVDIVAYRDPLGAEEPRLKVQVKKQESPVGDKVITELHGNLTEGEIGVVVSNSGFSKTRPRSRPQCSKAYAPY